MNDLLDYLAMSGMMISAVTCIGIIADCILRVTKKIKERKNKK